MKGKLIAIEGADGLGKTTLINKLKEEYDANFKFFREPGGNPTSEAIRKNIFELSDDTSDTDKLFMFHTSRLILWYKQIKPLLDAGTNVILDRFYLSTIIYENCLGDYDKIIHELLKEYKDSILNIVLTTPLINANIENKRVNSFDEKYDKHIINEKYIRFLTNLNNGCEITKYNYKELEMNYYENINKSIIENYTKLKEIVNDFLGEGK